MWYRIDKMQDVSIVNEKRRKGKEVLKKKDKTVYAQNHFSMYAGKEIIVTLLCGNNMVNVIVDCFGRGIHMLKVDGDYFSEKVDVAVNGNFLD